MKSQRTTYLALAFAGAMIAISASAAQAANQCIRVMDIDSTSTINSKTILVTMKSKNTFHRIDLMNDCPGLEFSGFLHETSYPQLCSSDTLKVLEPAGAVCAIKSIEKLDAGAAKALQAQR